jgi:NADH:ubiquinone oxidoreductase subunit 4 (subunit M)
VADLTLGEKLVMIPMTLLVFFIGLYPSYLTDRVETISRQLISAPAIKAACLSATDNSALPNNDLFYGDDR